jgi:E3 ubiquitin-protein ligase RNF31
VEYLVSVVYEANIDPLPILDLTDCVQELRRRGIPLPERGPWDTDPIYREMCQKVNKHYQHTRVCVWRVIDEEILGKSQQ